MGGTCAAVPAVFRVRSWSSLSCWGLSPPRRLAELQVAVPQTFLPSPGL